MNNIFENQNPQACIEIFETLALGKNIKIERIISNAQASAKNFWYEQQEDEWVCILEGCAQILFSGNSTPREIKKGEYLLIKRGLKHTVTKTSKDCIWLAVFGDFSA